MLHKSKAAELTLCGIVILLNCLPLEGKVSALPTDEVKMQALDNSPNTVLF